MGSTIKNIAFIAVIIILGVALGNYFQGNKVNDNNIVDFNPEINSNYQEVSFKLIGTEYTPNPIILKKGIPARLIGDTKMTGCGRAVNIPELGIQKIINPGDNVIEFTPTKAGDFLMTCSMGMMRGSIKVIE